MTLTITLPCAAALACESFVNFIGVSGGLQPSGVHWLEPSANVEETKPPKLKRLYLPLRKSITCFTKDDNLERRDSIFPL